MYTNEKLEEIKLLDQFDLGSTSSGLKIHTHEASEETIAAAARLFEKGLTNHVDGGYLTDRGIEAANHAQSLMRLLSD
ncbi:MAG TPA: TIGR02647 family protein [Thiotrichaceae bacterium]|nr:TIGR02647 family protein [Thiotrichaceae bacterium]HIM07581.1 TIGR02647 family protein [Gammaproteobacteria bacterium]